MAVRRVRRVIRKIDPWTVLKVSLIFNAIGGLVFVLGVWVMWSLAIQRGIPDRLAEFFDNFALVFNAEGELYFRVVVLLAIITAVLLTGLMTLGAVLYNLISDLVGGIELIVLEETYLVPATRQAPVRPAVHMASTAEVDTVRDESIIGEEKAADADDESDESDESDEEEPIGWRASDVDDEADTDEAVDDEDITVEDDEAPIAAASEG